MSYKDNSFDILANNVIKNLEKRNMEGYYFKDSKSCVATILDMIPDNCKISWGGSMTIEETGLMDALKNGNYELIDRTLAKDEKESRELFAKAVLADYFFMSTNAMTYDGELVNIDGKGNRVACLIQGPEYVFVVVGRNKLTASIDSAVERVRNVASPANAIRLKRNLPCGLTGRCYDCLSPDCFCNQVVITRRNGQPGRIKVFLINEDLGY